MITKNVEILNSIRGQLLVAMPHMDDERFKQSVILMCQHDNEAAMGLVINKVMPHLDLNSLRKKLPAKRAFLTGMCRFMLVGLLKVGVALLCILLIRCFQIPLPVGSDMGMSTQLSMINEIAAGTGPSHHRIMLGYAGWDKGQLESELREGLWFHTTASLEFIFHTPPEALWDKCFALAGFNAATLSPKSGSAWDKRLFS